MIRHQINFSLIYRFFITKFIIKFIIQYNHFYLYFKNITFYNIQPILLALFLFTFQT